MVQEFETLCLATFHAMGIQGKLVVLLSMLIFTLHPSSQSVEE
jgi:hypothetical protein